MYQAHSPQANIAAIRQVLREIPDRRLFAVGIVVYYDMPPALQHKNSARTRIEIIRFFATGTVVLGVDAIVYFLGLNVMPITISKAVSFMAGGIVAFLLNKYWTFGNKQRCLREFGRFWVANLITMAVNVGVNQAVLMLTQGDKVPAVVSASVASGVTAFLVQKSWVFGTHQRPSG